MDRKQSRKRVGPADVKAMEGDEVEHAPADGSADQVAEDVGGQPDEVERARGASAQVPTRQPKPPPREDDGAAAEGPAAAEEFRDDEWLSGTGETPPPAAP